jgi:hypothetical protein
MFLKAATVCSTYNGEVRNVTISRTRYHFYPRMAVEDLRVSPDDAPTARIFSIDTAQAN